MPLPRQQFLCDRNQLNPVGIRLCALAAFAILLLGILVQQGNASNGDNVVVPLTRKGPVFSQQSGLQIRVDSTWAGNRGYRPLTITASMAKPATADTLITIRFHAGNGRNDHWAISVEHDFELSQGATNSTTTFSVPQYVDWNTCGWEVWVDGVKEEELSPDLHPFNSGTTNTVAAGYFSPSPTNVYPALLLALVRSIEPHSLDLSNLPERWTDYSPLDVFSTSASSLEVLRVSSPEKLAELLRWVRSGGNLWVLDVGQNFSELPELEMLLFPNLDEKAAARSKPLSNWHYLMRNENGRPRQSDLAALTMQIPVEATTFSSTFIMDSSIPNNVPNMRQSFVARAYGLGTVAALQNRGGNQRHASVLERSSLAENLDWATRHGNDPSSGNPNFNNLLIPDVGTAPVFEFQLLISLFVIGIGPFNYWLLRRRNQLPLLLVTVPVAALAATLLLFTYGILADGIGVRVRVRSMTLLDQRVGEVASWARLSYYAGIAPSDGLQMPVDTVVYPILPSRSGSNNFSRRRVKQQRSLEWNQQQQLTRGWLGSRTPTQYLAITARLTKKQLEFEVQPEQLIVTNQLGTQVLALVVQDHEGNVFVGDSLDAEGTAKLAPSTYVQAASTIRKLLTENLPQLPVGFVSKKRLYNSDYGVSMTESLMELHFEAIVSPVATGWGNGTYVAVTATGIEVPLGVDGATESSSFHVVRGTW